ncbi:hypothetical protein ACF0H5_015840 [Mactra antiquata]
MNNRRKHLQRISHNIARVNPTLSRYYYERAVECILTRPDGEKLRSSLQSSKCLSCYSPLHSNTTNVKLLPKLHHSKQITKLMKTLGQEKQLGKYQNKLVYEYVNGHNKLVIKCLLCKKSRTVNGQNRLDRQKQKEIVKKEKNLQIPQNEAPVNSRKVKKKERRKLLQQKRKLGEDVDGDKNAGLIIPTDKESSDKKSEESKITEENKCDGKDLNILSDDKKQRVSIHKDKNSYTNYVESRNPRINKRQTNSNSSINNYINVSMKASANIKGKSNNQTGGKNLLEVCAQRTYSDKRHATMVGKVKKSTSEKKNKVKNMSQQLGLILKKEKEKQSSTGSLTDFLSSL